MYDYYCVLCHGATGNGDGFNSYILTTPPAKLADPNLMGKLSDAQIMAVVKKGGAALGLSSQMPSWGGLFKNQDITALIAYIRTLSKPGGGKGDKRAAAELILLERIIDLPFCLPRTTSLCSP